MTKPYCIETISSLEALQQDAKWWDIYYTSFPVAEIEPRQAIFNCLNQQAGLSFKIREKKSNATIGLAHGQFLHAFKALMLIYIAIDKRYRGQNLGTELLNFIASQVNAHYGMGENHGIVLEVDQPASFSAPEKRVIAERRIDFYEQLGYRIIEDVIYHQPPLKPEHDSLPMFLMIKNTALTTQEKQVLIHAIYFEKYSESYGISAINHQAIEAVWKKILKLNNW